MNGARGLTLLEMLVAMALCSALVGATALQYRRLVPAWELKAAVRQVILDLTEARTRAISEGRPFRLRFTTPGGTYQRERRGDDGTYEGDGPAISLPTHVEVSDCTARGAAISFQPRGHAGSFGTLTMRNSDGELRLVIVDIAGRMRIQ